jgi:phosphonate transport system permease protein
LKAAYASIAAEEITLAIEACPEVFSASLSSRARKGLIWFFFILLTIYCLWRMDFLNLKRLVTGVGKLGDAMAFMFPPSAHGDFFELLYAMLQTVAMAFLGTLLSTMASIPLGFLGAKNVVSQPIGHFGLRRVFDVIRGIDALIWALIFVTVVGLGPFTGILAIAVSDTGTLAKLFSEAIESVNAKEVEGVRASGANGIQIVRLGMLPQVFPVILSQMLYFFESNTRSAMILGVVGAGGIGLELSDRIRLCAWDEAMFIIIMILVTVSIIDTLSKTIRLRVIGNNTANKA